MAEPMKLAADGVAATQFEIPGARGAFRIQILNEDADRGVVTSIVHIPPGGFIPAVEKGIEVLEVSGSNVVSVAEHVVMSILLLVRNFVPAHEVRYPPIGHL